MTEVQTPPEQRVLLRNVSWETYERLLAEHPDSASPRFAYDRGMLEIVVVSGRHELPNRLLAQVVEIVTEEMDVEVQNLGSMTFKGEPLQRGFEPGSCFYIQNEEAVRGKTDVPPEMDPPPDLIIEVDITSPSLSRFPIYAGFGVPEIWRYDGKRVTILELKNEEYVEAARSTALPPLTPAALTRFVEEGLTLGRREWVRRVRGWVRGQR